MTGARKPYTHQSMFWSDLGPDIGYEAIGLVDAKLPTVSVFAKASEKDTPKAAAAETNQAMRSESEGESKEHVVASGEGGGLETKEGDKYGKGVVFYLKNDVVVGVVLWNVFGRMSLARRVLKENKKFDDIADLAKLFDIHSEK